LPERRYPDLHENTTRRRRCLNHDVVAEPRVPTARRKTAGAFEFPAAAGLGQEAARAVPLLLASQFIVCCSHHFVRLRFILDNEFR